jgi:hypothetical protein
MTDAAREEREKVVAWLREQMLSVPTTSFWDLLFRPWRFVRRHAEFMAYAKARKAIERGEHREGEG